MRSVVVLSDAAEDLEQAKEFYDSQESGIGDHFLDSLLADIQSLALFYGVHPSHFGFHRMLATKFPFGIYYEERTDELEFRGPRFAKESNLDSNRTFDALSCDRTIAPLRNFPQ